MKNAHISSGKNQLTFSFLHLVHILIPEEQEYAREQPQEDWKIEN